MEASAQQQPVTVTELKEIDLSLIEVSGANPRKNIKGESFKELKASIAEHGILEPLVVRPKGSDKYEVVAGERRYTAAKELKLEMVPCSVRKLDDHSARVIMLLENLQREDLAPLEEAHALEELLIPYGTPIGTPHMTQEALAKKLGKSQPWIANRLRLNKAPKDLKDLLAKGKVTTQHVMTLLPFVEWPIYDKVLRDRLVHDLQDADTMRETYTVASLRDMIEGEIQGDEKGQNSFRVNHLPWKLQKYGPYLDRDACKNCKEPIQFKDFNDAKDDRRQVCLKTDCFRAKFKAAAKAYKDAEAKKMAAVEKAESVKMSSLQYGQYEVLDYAKFPKAVCKDCLKKKLSKENVSSLEGEGNKKRTLCMDPACFRQKRSAWREVEDRYGEQVQEAVLKAFKLHVSSRPAGLAREELLFVYETFQGTANEGQLKRGKVKKFSEQEIEAELLNVALFAIFDGFYHAEDLRKIVKSFPFKVDLPEKPVLEEKPEPENVIDPALVDAEKAQAKKDAKAKKTKKKAKGANS